MANKAKVATEVETLNEEVATEVETLNEEVATEVETLANHYTVIANLKHNGKRYNVGDKISLSEDEALALIGTVE